MDEVTVAFEAFTDAISLCTIQADADQAAADSVTALISALPKNDGVKVSDREAIEAARAAYDALSDTQKTLVSNDTTPAKTDVPITASQLTSSMLTPTGIKATAVCATVLRARIPAALNHLINFCFIKIPPLRNDFPFLNFFIYLVDKRITLECFIGLI
jgi:hypothetical protein